MGLSKTLSCDVTIVGAGHNGLTAAAFLARQGLDVLVLEEKSMIGGATKTEYPFSKAPNLGTSSGSYLLGLMPPELEQKLGVKIPVIRRDPHYFLPTTDRRYLLFGSDQKAMEGQFREHFSEQDWKANLALITEIGQMRDDLAPCWLEEPLSLEATAQRYIRPALRQVFIDLCTKPIENYLSRFQFKSQLLMAMYAVTDSFSGLNASFGTPGAGHNFLVHNMCRLPGSDGTFMICKGGMGTIANILAQTATQAGARIFTNSKVESIETQDGTAQGLVLKDGRRVQSKVILFNSDPFTTMDLLGEKNLPKTFVDDLNSKKRHGTTMKVNLALKGLPKFKCLPENKGQYASTIHLLPEDLGDGRYIDRIHKGFEEVQAGRLADFPTIEWYIHTTADPSLQDQYGHHNSAFFVQWVPYELKGTTWEKEESRYVKHLLSIADRFAPGTSDLVVDTFTLTPDKVEKHFGIKYGHIHHLDNAFAFDERAPYRWPMEGVYSCSAGCHPAGSVIGASGHNAAQRILKDLGLQ